MNELNNFEIKHIISKEDLTIDLKLVLDICGMETVIKMINNLGGLSIYIPKISHLDTLVKKYIKKNPEKTLKEIAKELKVSEPFLKNVTKR